MKTATVWLILAFNAVAICAQSIQLLNFDETTPITTVTLHEDTTAQTSLAIVRCVDAVVTAAPIPTVNPPVLEDCICNLDRTIPANGPFDVWKLNNNNNNNNQVNINVNEKDFKAYFVGTAQATSTIDYDTQRTHLIIARCASPTKPFTASVIIEVDILPNQQPVISNYPSGTTTVTGTKNVKAGGSIYNVGCTDPDQDTLQYTLSTDPITTNIFQIDSSGIIRAQADLSSFCRSSITFNVTCKDPYNDAVGPVYIQATLSGANQQPSITGINFNRDVPEDTAVDTTLGTFTVNDDDNVNCLLFASPTESLQYFDLNFAHRAIVVKSKLNYEQTATRNTTLTVTCTDNFCTSNAAYLYVRVTEVNEPIELFPQDFTLSTYEGNIDIDPNWTPIDEDEGDDPTYTIVGGNAPSRFAINPTSGRITSTLEYDVDGGAMATTDTIVVQVKDEGGHSSTTTVFLTILDSNDNRPTFNNVDSQTFVVQNCTTPGTSAGSILATDADSTFQGNNVLTYSGSNGPLTVSPNGAILIGSDITTGTTYSVQVTVTDAGEVPQALSSLTPATVTVFVTDCTAQNSEPGDCLDSAAVINELTFGLLCTAVVLSPAILMFGQT